jgi:hypothetical protein
MGRISAENILFDFALYLTLAVPFGIAVASADIQTALNQIFGPWPTVSSVTQAVPKCGSTDIACQAQAGIAQATAFIAVPFLWIGAIILSGLQRLNAFGTVSIQLTTGPSSSLTTIPGAGFIVFGLIVLVAFELFRMFRGSPSGT